MPRKEEFFIILNDLTYKTIDDLDEITSTHPDYTSIKYIVKKYDAGNTYTTSQGTTYDLDDYIIFDRIGSQTQIKHLGAYCKSFEEVSKSILMGDYSIADIVDSNGNIRFKGFSHSGISFVISVIKLVEDVGEAGSWEEYNYRNNIKEWLLVRKDLKVVKYLKPTKYHKNALYWIKQVYEGEVHVTYLHNVYPLYEFKILGRNLKRTSIDYFGWSCWRIFEIYKSFTDCRVEFYVSEKKNNSRSFKISPESNEDMIIRIIENIKSLGESGYWNIYDLKEKDRMQYLEETLQIVANKVVEYEEMLKINPNSIEKYLTK